MVIVKQTSGGGGGGAAEVVNLLSILGVVKCFSSKCTLHKNKPTRKLRLRKTRAFLIKKHVLSL